MKPATNFKTLEEFAGGDKEFIIDILITFLDAAPENNRVIDASCRERNCDNLLMVTHKLKSTFRFIGNESLGEMAHVIEQRCKNKELDLLDDLVHDFVRSYNAMIIEVEQELNRLKSTQ